MLRIASLLVLSCLPGVAQALVQELNALRANPAAYADTKLEARRAYYRGKLLQLPGQTPYRTEEGVQALDEAIKALKSSGPLTLVKDSPVLQNTAAAHVKDIGPKGSTSHQSSDGLSSTERIHRAIPQAKRAAEVMAFGPDDAASVLIELLIDDGDKNRGHRRILLDPGFRAAGGTCGPHTTYKTVCVMDLADVPAAEDAGFTLMPKDPNRRRFQRE